MLISCFGRSSCCGFSFFFGFFLEMWWWYGWILVCLYIYDDGVANFLRNALSNCSHLPPEWVNMLGSVLNRRVEYGEQPAGIWIFPLYPLRSRVRGDPIYFSRYYGPPPTSPLASTLYRFYIRELNRYLNLRVDNSR